MKILLGNASVLDVAPGPDDPNAEELSVGGEVRFRRPDISPSVTVVEVPEGDSFADALTTITRLWPYHSDQPAAWVQSDNPAMATVLAQQFGCEIREEAQ